MSLCAFGSKEFSTAQTETTTQKIPAVPYYCCLCDSAYDKELQFKTHTREHLHDVPAQKIVEEIRSWWEAHSKSKIQESSDLEYKMSADLQRLRVLATEAASFPEAIEPTKLRRTVARYHVNTRINLAAEHVCNVCARTTSQHELNTFICQKNKHNVILLQTCF